MRDETLYKEIRKMMVDYDLNVTELSEELGIARNSVYAQFKTMNQRKFDAMAAAIKRAGNREEKVN